MREAGRVLTAERHGARSAHSMVELDDPGPACTLLVATAKDEFSVLSASDLVAAGAWLYGTPGRVAEATLAGLPNPTQLTDCHLLLSRIDHSLLNRIDHPGDELSAVLQTSLRQRVGSRLTDPAEVIYFYLLGTKAALGGIQVSRAAPSSSRHSEPSNASPAAAAHPGPRPTAGTSRSPYPTAE
jgi:hypothetical protein